jgi:N-acetylmuramoyl-L-alanine amidase CwlA
MVNKKRYPSELHRELEIIAVEEIRRRENDTSDLMRKLDEVANQVIRKREIGASKIMQDMQELGGYLNGRNNIQPGLILPFTPLTVASQQKNNKRVTEKQATAPITKKKKSSSMKKFLLTAAAIAFPFLATGPTRDVKELPQQSGKTPTTLVVK